MSTPLLVTKLYTPPPRPTVVPRPRLLERLNAGLQCKLTLIATPAEAAGFLTQAMGLARSADEIDALEIHTEGWIADLQLATLSLHGHRTPTSFITSFTGSSRFIIDFLADEVLERQPDEVRAFLHLLVWRASRSCGVTASRRLPRCRSCGPPHSGARLCAAPPSCGAQPRAALSR